MTAKNIIIAGLCLAVLVLAFNAGLDYQKKRAWAEREQWYESRLTEKDRQLTALGDLYAVIRAELEKQSAEILRLKAESNELRKKQLKDEAVLRDSSPAEQVEASKQLLGRTDLWISGDRVVMTFECFEEVAVRMQRERWFSLQYVPKLEETIKVQDEKILKLEVGQANLLEQVAGWSAKYDLLKNEFSEYKKMKGKTFIQQVVTVGKYVGLGVLIGLAL